jgi:Zn finger protein HypA/HybF involved in hydrogenase expression
MMNQSQMQAECALCHKTWTINVGEYGVYLCPYCPSSSVKLTPLYETKDVKTPKPRPSER